MIDSKLFIIANSEVADISTSFKSLKLSSGGTLYYHNKLRVTGNVSNSAVLIGDAWQTVDAKSPEDLIRLLKGSETRDDIYKIEQTWCGRYILIVGDYLYLDTSGTMCCFYSNSMISNNLELLRNVNGGGVEYPNIEHGKSPDFALGPYTQYKEFKRLLPSQVLDIRNLQAHFRPILAVDYIQPFSDENRLMLLERLFVKSILNLENHFSGKEIWTAVTGGRDSRVTLAMLLKSGIKFNGFTFWHDKISRNDVIIPKRLAKIAHFNYEFVDESFRVKDQSQFHKQQEYCSGLTAERTWEALPQINQLKKEREIVIIRSGIFEFACNYYHYDPCSFDVFKIYPHVVDVESSVKSLKHWQKMIDEDTLNSNICNTDRLYYDMRLGCWLSSTEQSFDIIDGVTPIQICNCRAIISLLKGFSERIRHGRRFEELITNHAYPLFSKVPYDYQCISMKQKIKNTLSRLKHKLLDK